MPRIASVPLIDRDLPTNASPGAQQYNKGWTFQNLNVELESDGKIHSLLSIEAGNYR